MSQQSFPGGTSSPSSNNDDLTTDDTTDDGNMEDYVKRWEERNSEETHKAALAAAHAHHTAIREKALEVLEISKLREETEKLRQKRIQTEERVRLETERAMEELRIREEENKAKLIPKPPPRVPTPLQPIQQPVQQPKQPEFTPAPANQPVNQFAQAPKQASAPNIFQSSQTQPPPNTSQPNLKQSTSQQTTPATASHPMQAQLQVSAQQPKQAQQPTQAPSMTAQRPQAPPDASQAHQASWAARPASQHLEEQKIMHQSVDRYADIHRNLKDLRRVIRQFGELNRQFKNEAGAMRRAIIMSVGQLTEGRGVNKVQMQNICAQLDASLAMPIPPKFEKALLFNPALIMTSTPAPSKKEDTPNNGDKMPLLTIYLLNILAKAAISQFCTEAGANPKAADPVGTLIISIFAQSKYCWRGKSLIEIMIAKFRITCPVLFGFRGNEKTEEGRARLGWKKDVNSNWISEQEHNDRMTGLGAGWASICLRDFSRTQLDNPWPPIKYWKSLAFITNTPPGETSSTQFVVLKAMIDNYTALFFKCFGDMGVRALHDALQVFPRKAAAGNVAASSLQVLAAKLQRDSGLLLAVS